MVLLVHHNISPHSRKIRILMAEKKMLFALQDAEPWNLPEDILKINPAGELPILIFDAKMIVGNYAITEYLEEKSKENSLLKGDLLQRAEIRRLCAWFDDKFYKEVYQNIVTEKVFKRFRYGLSPDTRRLKAGLHNLKYHLEYIDWLAYRNNYLAGNDFSLADITAAAHISVIDYLGDIEWDEYKNAKIWYSKIKSRASFQDILKDKIKGILPSKQYRNLDF